VSLSLYVRKPWTVFILFVNKLSYKYSISIIRLCKTIYFCLKGIQSRDLKKYLNSAARIGKDLYWCFLIRLKFLTAFPSRVVSCTYVSNTFDTITVFQYSSYRYMDNSCQIQITVKCMYIRVCTVVFKYVSVKSYI